MLVVMAAVEVIVDMLIMGTIGIMPFMEQIFVIMRIIRIMVPVPCNARIATCKSIDLS